MVYVMHKLNNSNNNNNENLFKLEKKQFKRSECNYKMHHNLG